MPAGFNRIFVALVAPDHATAEADLAAMRAVVALFEPDREQGLPAMRVEARQIQDRMTFERELRSDMLRQGSSGFDSDSEKAKGDLVDNDPDEWWRTMQDGNIPKEGEDAAPKPKAEIRNPDEASRLLHAFNPAREGEGVEELQRLLYFRADPSSPPTIPGGMSPPHKVNFYALEEDVSRMRHLLFLYGAEETETDKEPLAWRPHINDATRRLQVFRPVRESTEALKKLLDLRADPCGMVPRPPDSMSPLLNVNMDLEPGKTKRAFPDQRHAWTVRHLHTRR